MRRATACLTVAIGAVQSSLIDGMLAQEESGVSVAGDEIDMGVGVNDYGEVCEQ